MRELMLHSKSFLEAPAREKPEKPKEVNNAVTVLNNEEDEEEYSEGDEDIENLNEDNMNSNEDIENNQYEDDDAN